jgi:hypothetical protein
MKDCGHHAKVKGAVLLTLGGTIPVENLGRQSLKGVVLLLGLYRGPRFSYARAIVTNLLNISIIDNSIAKDLKCYESVSPEVEAEVVVPGLGKYDVRSVCVVDRVVFNGYEIPYPSVFHVVTTSTGPRLYEAFIGRDLINYWQLYVDPSLETVRSRMARRVELF